MVNNITQKNLAIKQEDDKYKQNGDFKARHKNTSTIKTFQNMQNTSWMHNMNMEQLKALWTFYRSA
jgi:hypothetical protein